MIIYYYITNLWYNNKKKKKKAEDAEEEDDVGWKGYVKNSANKHKHQRQRLGGCENRWGDAKKANNTK